MSIRAIELPANLADYVDDRVRSGHSSDASQVVQKALRVLRAVEDRRSAFDDAVQDGLDAIERGDFDDIQDLDLWFVELRKSWRA